jgi:protein-S-isoprenylcysteine O-methyltransferase Ste14
LLRDGAAASLLAALLGLLFNLTAGVAHGAGLLAARPAIAAWGVGFLLPLVTGALTQLLPVWRWPGRVIPARAVMREKLAATGVWRAAFLLLGGLAIIAGLPLAGGVFAGAAIALFALALVPAIRTR